MTETVYGIKLEDHLSCIRTTVDKSPVFHQCHAAGHRKYGLVLFIARWTVVSTSVIKRFVLCHADDLECALAPRRMAPL